MGFMTDAKMIELGGVVDIELPKFAQRQEFVCMCGGFIAVEQKEYTDKPHYFFRGGKMIAKGNGEQG